MPVLVSTPLAQGDGVVFIFSSASLIRACCSAVAAPIEKRIPVGGGDGGGSDGCGDDGGGGGAGGGGDGGDGDGGGGDGGGGGAGGGGDDAGDDDDDVGGEGEGELSSRLSATIPTTRAATATMPTSPIATSLADTRDLGAVAVAGSVTGGGSAGTVSSTSPLIVQTKLPSQECGRVWCVVSRISRHLRVGARGACNMERRRAGRGHKCGAETPRTELTEQGVRRHAAGGCQDRAAAPCGGLRGSVSRGSACLGIVSDDH